VGLPELLAGEDAPARAAQARPVGEAGAGGLEDVGRARVQRERLLEARFQLVVAGQQSPAAGRARERPGLPLRPRGGRVARGGRRGLVALPEP
jgi:hypothetical protein